MSYCFKEKFGKDNTELDERMLTIAEEWLPTILAMLESGLIEEEERGDAPPYAPEFDNF